MLLTLLMQTILNMFLVLSTQPPLFHKHTARQKTSRTLRKYFQNSSLVPLLNYKHRLNGL